MWLLICTTMKLTLQGLKNAFLVVINCSMFILTVMLSFEYKSWGLLLGI